MSELESLKPLRHHNRKMRRHQRARAAVGPIRFVAQPFDWKDVFAALPQEKPKDFADSLWNGYKDEIWTKYKPEGRLLFELLRMVVRDPNMPDIVRLCAGIGSLFVAVDGFDATAEGLKNDKARMPLRIAAPVPQLFPAWPS